MSLSSASDDSPAHPKDDLEQFEMNETTEVSEEYGYWDDDSPLPIAEHYDETERMLNQHSVDFEDDNSTPRTLLAYSRKIWRSVSRFLDGPKVPKEPRVTPIFKSVQYFPATVSQRWPYSLKVGIIVSYLICWTLLFTQLAKHSILATPYVDGKAVQLLTCSATPAIWRGKNQHCGIYGENCGATELKEFFFKCPASCKEDSHVWSDTAVGNNTIIYRPFVIGGENSYRADSFICASALHHRVTSNNRGFCGRIKFKGPASNFVSEKAGSGITSLSFDSLFPQSYEFDDNFTADFETTGCRDLRMTIMTVNIILSFIFGYIVQNGTVFYWTFAVMGFWTVVLASNPPFVGETGDLIAAELLSIGARRFMPYMFGCYVIYTSSGRGQLVGLKESLFRTIFWVGGFWLALLENYTFSMLPVNRLVVSDINSQKGGWITVIGIAGFILFAAFGQIYIIWRLGKLKKYVTVYFLMVLGIVILGNIKNQTLRLHHYILGLVLLPGVGFKTTPSLLFFGLLFGLYISGVARWDFDSIIQTAAQLNRGDATLIGGLPQLIEPAIEYGNATDVVSSVAAAGEHIANIMLQWSDMLSFNATTAGRSEDPAMPSENYQDLWNGYSLIINDVEQYRGSETTFSLQPWLNNPAWATSQERNLYIRLAFANTMAGVDSTGGKVF